MGGKHRKGRHDTRALPGDDDAACASGSADGQPDLRHRIDALAEQVRQLGERVGPRAPRVIGGVRGPIAATSLDPVPWSAGEPSVARLAETARRLADQFAGSPAEPAPNDWLSDRRASDHDSRGPAWPERRAPARAPSTGAQPSARSAAGAEPPVAEQPAGDAARAPAQDNNPPGALDPLGGAGGEPPPEEPADGDRDCATAPERCGGIEPAAASSTAEVEVEVDHGRRDPQPASTADLGAEIIAMAERAALEIRADAEREAARIRAAREGDPGDPPQPARGALTALGAETGQIAHTIDVLRSQIGALEADLRRLSAEVDALPVR